MRTTLVTYYLITGKNEQVKHLVSVREEGNLPGLFSSPFLHGLFLLSFLS